MPCYRPLQAIRRRDGSIAFTGDRPADLESIELPCGRCFGCQMRRSQSWAIRCQHEAALYDRNCFVTLTYDDSHLPADGGLRYGDVQGFLKRLRRQVEGFQVAPNGKRPIRFFCCGEYGETTFRPHYHLLLFNENLLEDSYRVGAGTYSSARLERLWSHGNCVVGAMSSASIAYVTRYSLKKVYGQRADEHYAVIDLRTGELVAERKREFVVMSRRPGIGAWWFDRYESDMLPRDVAVVKGFEAPVPRYYLERYGDRDPIGKEDVKFRRLAKMREVPVEDRSESRRAVAEQVARARLEHYAGKRSF